MDKSKGLNWRLENAAPILHKQPWTTKSGFRDLFSFVPDVSRSFLWGHTLNLRQFLDHSGSKSQSRSENSLSSPCQNGPKSSGHILKWHAHLWKPEWIYRFAAISHRSFDNSSVHVESKIILMNWMGSGGIWLSSSRTEYRPKICQP